MTKEKVVHAKELLKREISSVYAKEWANLLRVKSSEKQEEFIPLILFDLCSEHFAIDANLCVEICDLKKIHSLPNNLSSLIRGVVNIRGQITYCYSLEELLGLEKRQNSHSKMVVLKNEQKMFVFAVDHVQGMHRLKKSQRENLPTTLEKSRANYLEAIYFWNEQK